MLPHHALGWTILIFLVLFFLALNWLPERTNAERSRRVCAYVAGTVSFAAFLIMLP